MGCKEACRAEHNAVFIYSLLHLTFAKQQLSFPPPRRLSSFLSSSRPLPLTGFSFLLSSHAFLSSSFRSLFFICHATALRAPIIQIQPFLHAPQPRQQGVAKSFVWQALPQAPSILPLLFSSSPPLHFHNVRVFLLCYCTSKCQALGRKYWHE